MANRIVGNVYIIDTGSANTALPWPKKGEITEVSFWSTNTNGIVELTGANTTNVVVKIQNPNHVPATLSQSVYTSFGELKVPTLTAGTAWIYFR